MHDVVIVGVGGLGREVAQWIEDINAVTPTFHVVGFLDDDRAKHEQTSHDLPVLGGIDWVRARPGTTAAVVAIGNPAVRRRVVERLRASVLGFPVIRHPDATVGRTVEVGIGTIICPGVIATVDLQIGRFVALNYDLTIGHDALVDDFVTLAPGVHVSGYARIGEGTDVGAGATILPAIEVGAWSIVGSGAVVTTSLPANCTAVGVPARVIKTRAPAWHLDSNER
jgi:sugar O-acyltransferase (sialic acid O-acetyltransferase NeuD family)